MDQRRGCGIVQGVLGQLKIAHPGDQSGKYPPPVRAQGLIEQANSGWIGGEDHQ